jgi:hypothetical protein
MPEEAEYYTIDKYSKEKVYWKTCKAFNMKLLEFWENNKWNMKFGYLPWNELIPIK